MGTVYRKTATKPLPAEAKIIVRKGQRLAEWTDAKKKRRTATVTTGRDGTDRIVVVARTYTAKYRDGSGVVREVATGCRDESAARSILTDLEKRAEKVKGGILTAAEDAAIDHQHTPIGEHVAAYLAHQEAKGLNQVRVKNSGNRLARLTSECGFRCLSAMTAEALEHWLATRQADGMSAGTRNEYRQELIGFGNWCVRTRRLLTNPFAFVAKADAKADCRRKRRALTEDELRRLLFVARIRPLADHGRETIRREPDEAQGKQKRSHWTYAPLNLDNIEAAAERGRMRLAKRPDFIAERERLGRERVLIYKTLVLTGLRKNELASITVGQLALDEEPACVVLRAADEKNREGSTIPLRADLAADIRAWLAEKAEKAAEGSPSVRFDPNYRNADHCATGGPGTIYGLPADTPLFTVPAGLIRILDRDLRAAGIPKVDERGRTIDVHALRHTFGTLLSKGGVYPRTAQAAMRHSTIDLTMNTYTDPKLLDVAGAMETLPSLPIGPEDRQSDSARIAASATGTDDLTPCQFAPKFAPTSGKSSNLLSNVVKMTAEKTTPEDAAPVAVSAYPVKRKDRLSTADNRSSKVGAKGFEPSTSASRTQRSSQAELRPGLGNCYSTSGVLLSKGDVGWGLS